MRCEFLPPCSPDFNPIELALSAMKDNLRKNGDYTRMATTELSDQELYFTFIKALYVITLDDVSEWYARCGYVC